MKYKDIKIGQSVFLKECDDRAHLYKNRFTVINKYDTSKLIVLGFDGGGLLKTFCKNLSENPQK